MAIADFKDATDESFSDQLHGKDIRLSDEEHDGGHTVKSGMIGKEVAVNARSMGTADVMAAGNFAWDRDRAFAGKGSSHNPAAAADGEDGVVGSPSPINTVRVETAERITIEGTQNVFQLIDVPDMSKAIYSSIIEVCGDSQIPN